MPIPFIIAGVAIAAGSYGVKKGVDAKDDFDTAKYWNKKAKKIYKKARRALKRKKENTDTELQKSYARIWCMSNSY